MCGIRGSQPVRFHDDRERGASGMISRKARRRWNYRSRSEHCKSGRKVGLRRAALRELRSKKPLVPSAPTDGSVGGESLLYVNHVYDHASTRVNVSAVVATRRALSELEQAAGLRTLSKLLPRRNQ